MVALLGAAAMIEMIYHWQLNAAVSSELQFLGLTLNINSVNVWVGAIFVMLTGIALFECVRRQFKIDWDAIQVDIEKEIKRREALGT
jgi:branched-chain amino acid transport system permease protein